MYRFVIFCIAAIPYGNVQCNAQFFMTEEPDTLVFGGRKYFIDEAPMLGLWNGGVGTGTQERPTFQPHRSGNMRGYLPQFEIRESKLFLRRIVGRIDGKKRKNEEIIPGTPFPIVATWFTGDIHLFVGDVDSETQDSTAVIILHIHKGVAESMGFAERMRRVRTWNGLPEAGAVERHAEQCGEPELPSTVSH